MVVVLFQAITARGRAQTDEARSAARSAATEGLRALQEGRYSDAVDLCTRAEALMHAPTHLLLIARAQTKLGHLVEAQEAYIKIEREHLAPGAPRAFMDAQAKATEEEAQLAPRVPTLRVDVVGADAKDVEVTLDGVSLPNALIGLAGPVNPGSHTLRAKTSVAAADPVTVTILEGAKQTARLTLTPLPASAAAPADAAAPPVAPAAGEPGAGVGPSGLRTGGWISIGLGVAGVAAGTVFVFKNHQDRNDANALCGPLGCPESRRADIASFDDAANTSAALAWVSYGVGAAALVTGATLLVLGHGKPGGALQTGQVIPWVGVGAAGARVTF
jgi:hypothetical protein